MGHEIFQTDLKKSDEIGEEQEHGLVADPLQHPEHDECAAINDEPGRENGFHSPDGQILPHKRTFETEKIVTFR